MRCPWDGQTWKLLTSPTPDWCPAHERAQRKKQQVLYKLSKAQIHLIVKHLECRRKIFCHLIDYISANNPDIHKVAILHCELLE